MTHLYRTQTTGNRRTFTVSTWIKFSGSYGSSGAIILNTDGSNANQNFMFQLNSDTIKLHLYGGDVFTTSRKLRDYNAWYHIVLGIDTTQASAGDRVKLYINGELQSITQESLYPAQNFDFGVGDNGRVMSIMGDHDNSNNYDNRSYISHYHFCDGYQYQASDFGSTDSTTGEWKINTNPSVNYGSTGFFLKFENSGNLTLDSGGNNISFSTSGTPIASQDNASNVFATLNPLSTDSGVTLSSGNTESDYDGSVGHAKGTLGFSSGKFYWEVKIATSASQYPMLGIGNLDAENMQKPTGGSYPGGFTGSYGAYGNGNVYANGSNTGSQSFTWTTNDIIGIAVDLDSGTKTIKWYKNGSQIAIYNITTDGPFASMDYNGGEDAVNLQYNFGNGYFGTTAVSSAGTNASGNGIFEYDVPTGYTALSTKGLNL